MEVVLLVSTAFSLSTTLITLFSGVFEPVKNFPQKVKLLQNELLTLRGVIDECFQTLDGGAIQAPPHVREMLIAANDQQQKVERLISRVTRFHENETERRVRLVLFAATREKELNSELAILRDKVGLLRDACSEIRLRTELVDLSAAMAKLTALSVTASLNTKAGVHGVPSESRSEGEITSRPAGNGFSLSDEQQLQIAKAIQDSALQPLRTLEADNFFVNGTIQLKDPTLEPGMVLVEDNTRTGGERFRYKPARIKIDTGSEADFVTREYLARIGYNLGELVEIPRGDRQPVEGLNKTMHTPSHRADVQWYLKGETHVQVTSFLVVDSGPFDMLLSSRNFVPLVSSALTLVRGPRKTREQIDKELEIEKRKLMEAKELEEKNLRAAKAMRNQEVGRATTIQSLAAPTSDGQELSDLENGHRAVGDVLGASAKTRLRGLRWWPFR